MSRTLTPDCSGCYFCIDSCFSARSTADVPVLSTSFSAFAQSSGEYNPFAIRSSYVIQTIKLPDLLDSIISSQPHQCLIANRKSLSTSGNFFSDGRGLNNHFPRSSTSCRSFKGNTMLNETKPTSPMQNVGCSDHTLSPASSSQQHKAAAI